VKKPFSRKVSSGIGRGREVVVAVLAGIAFAGGALARDITLPADAAGNTVDAFIRPGVVYAPLSTPGDPNSVSLRGNTVTVRDGDIAGESAGSVTSVVGGVDKDLAGTGEVSGNAVNVVGGTHGRKGKVYLYGGISRGNGSVVSNTVTVTDGSVNGTVFGGYSPRGSASHNKVGIVRATISGAVYGGVGEGGDADDNTITVTGGSIGGMFYGGGYSPRGNANGNTITVTDAAIGRVVFGGYAPRGSANNNALSLKNATVSDAVIIGGGSAISATGNTVTLSGQVRFTNETGILGGTGGGTVSGNTLTLDGFRQAGEGAVKGIRGFDKLTFAGIKAGQSVPVLTATGTVDLAGSRTTLRFDGEPGNVRLINAPKFIMSSATIDDVLYDESRYRFSWDATGSAVLSGTSPVNR
jgi:hypothetical protein